ncbi:hypothetical protein E4656_06775 [Natronospirillum operosum]|uniref:CENP-V/GFA domain-containing protein n=1 Tax=Natronospirillum operosum TaxID=2759953 RepID=A0A4Z0W8F6_9GAMM|nr:DUF6151 family protein [Natronospirillum operosum]TGG93887.1 hypothetical protein E4656_06775 [Natronospirillum operosum]
MSSTESTLVSCQCGQVEMTVKGVPILAAACYCDDCQAGGHQLEALPKAPPVLGDDGGTEFLLYRKDRVTVSRGQDLIRHYKLDDKSPTSRSVASCCNTAMFLDFRKGHWYSMYRARFGEAAPPLQLRIQTRFKSSDSTPPEDVPTYDSYPLRFIGKLMVARAAMLVSR